MRDFHKQYRGHICSLALSTGMPETIALTAFYHAYQELQPSPTRHFEAENLARNYLRS